MCVAGEGRSELDELQEEVARRAKEQELQRRKEKEKEAALGFNPRPSKFMDLDELQNQGTASACHERAKGVALSPDAFLGFLLWFNIWSLGLLVYVCVKCGCAGFRAEKRYAMMFVTCRERGRL